MGVVASNYKAKKMTLVGERFRIEERLGQGSFGMVYRGFDTKKKEQVAVKLEVKTARRSFLTQEARVYKVLKYGVGFPNFKWFGQIVPFYDVLVMDLLGPSLGDLFKDRSYRFSLKTVLMLADQIISRLEYLHNMNILHRDIKPENFTMGIGNTRNTLYLVDFGLSKNYRDYQTNEHMSFRDGKNLTGTARYVSANAHGGIECTRRDELESVGYVLVYFLRGSLPWQGVEPKLGRKQRYAKIGEIKSSTSAEELCEGLPKQFADFLKYCRGLSFTERPDYGWLRQLFRDLFKSRGYDFDYVYDWSDANNDLKWFKNNEIIYIYI